MTITAEQLHRAFAIYGMNTIVDDHAPLPRLLLVLTVMGMVIMAAALPDRAEPRGRW
jgi:hypothetical protein